MQNNNSTNYVTRMTKDNDISDSCLQRSRVIFKQTPRVFSTLARHLKKTKHHACFFKADEGHHENWKPWLILTSGLTLISFFTKVLNIRLLLTLKCFGVFFFFMDANSDLNICETLVGTVIANNPSNISRIFQNFFAVLITK